MPKDKNVRSVQKVNGDRFMNDLNSFDNNFAKTVVFSYHQKFFVNTNDMILAKNAIQFFVMMYEKENYSRKVNCPQNIDLKKKYWHASN